MILSGKKLHESHVVKGDFHFVVWRQWLILATLIFIIYIDVVDSLGELLKYDGPFGKAMAFLSTSQLTV